MAGVPGFEPGLSVLETDVLTVDTIPLQVLPIFQLPIANLNRRRSPQIENWQLAIGNELTWSLCDLCACGNGDRIC